MNEMIFETVKLIIMVVFAGMATYLIPLLKRKIGHDNLVFMDRWATNAVLYAEQLFTDYRGADKKAIVMSLLKEIRDKNSIALNDEQLEILIESAVKGMNMGIAGTIVDPYEGEE